METQSLRQVLADNGEAVIRTMGRSMEPLLYENESTVLLQRADGLCRKNDVILFLRPNGQYVLHRVVCTGEILLVQGDHQPFPESIRRDQVIGVMKGYHAHPDSPFCSVHSREYTRYLMLLPLRRGYITARARAGQLYRKWKERRK